MGDTLPAGLVFVSSEFPAPAPTFRSEAPSLPVLVTAGASADEVPRAVGILLVLHAHGVTEATPIVPGHPPDAVGGLCGSRGRLLLAGDTRGFRDGLARCVAPRTGKFPAQTAGVPLTGTLGSPTRTRR